MQTRYISCYDINVSPQTNSDFPATCFRQLAEFRYEIRRFIHFSEEAARSQDIEPQQHQLLLAIRGLPQGTRPTVRTLADRMCLRHHSTVELVNRLVQRGAAVRRPSDRDRREVLVELTPLGEELLHNLSVLHWQELQNSGPTLARSLAHLLGNEESVTEARLA